MPEEQALQRQDVLAIIDALAGIRTDLLEVIRLLKQKRTRRRRSPEERAADEAAPKNRRGSSESY